MSRRPIAALVARVPTVVSKTKEVGSALAFEIVMLASLVIVFPITIRGLGPERFGEYATMYVISGIAITWVHSGGAAAIVQLILQRGRDTATSVSFGRRQVALIGVPSVLGGLAVTAAVLGGHLWSVALLIFAADLLILGWAEIHLSAIYAHHGMGPVTRIKVWSPIVRATGIGTLGYLGEVTVLNLVLVNVTASVLVLVLSHRRIVRLLRSDDVSGSSTTHRELFRLGALYSTSMSTNAVQNEGEKLILANFRTTAEVGEYQAAYRIVAVALMPLRALHAAATRWFLLPDDRPGGHTRKAVLLSVPSIGYGLACAAAIVAGQPIVRWVLGDEFELAATITLWLCLVPLLHALAEIPPLGLLGLGQNRLRVYLGLGTSAAAIVAYLALIPRIGWQGAVIGTYISELTTITAGWWLLVRCQRRADAERARATG